MSSRTPSVPQGAATVAVSPGVRSSGGMGSSTISGSSSPLPQQQQQQQQLGARRQLQQQQQQQRGEEEEVEKEEEEVEEGSSRFLQSPTAVMRCPRVRSLPGSLRDRFRFLADAFLSNRDELQADLSPEESVRAYALIMQTVEGRNISPEPSFFVVFGETRDRWNAWNDLGDMGARQAAQRLVELLRDAVVDFDDKLERFVARYPLRGQNNNRGNNSNNNKNNRQRQGRRLRQGQLQQQQHQQQQRMSEDRTSLSERASVEERRSWDRQGGSNAIVVSPGRRQADLSGGGGGTGGRGRRAVGASGGGRRGDNASNALALATTNNAPAPAANPFDAARSLRAAQVAAVAMQSIVRMRRRKRAFNKVRWAAVRIQRAIRTQKARRLALAELECTMEEDRAKKQDELLAILRDGLTVIKYPRGIGHPSRRTMWLSEDGLRLCIDRTMATPTNRAKGLFVRDIAEVRDGLGSYSFIKMQREHSPDTPRESRAFTVVGTERTFDLMASSSITRTWLVERLRIFITNSLSADERTVRNRKHATVPHVAVIKSLQARKNMGAHGMGLEDVSPMFSAYSLGEVADALQVQHVLRQGMRMHIVIGRRLLPRIVYFREETSQDREIVAAEFDTDAGPETGQEEQEGREEEQDATDSDDAPGKDESTANSGRFHRFAGRGGSGPYSSRSAHDSARNARSTGGVTKAHGRIFFSRTQAPTAAEIRNNGVDVEDVCETRPGNDSHLFHHARLRQVPDPACCINIIGSERTISCVLSTPLAARLFLEKLQALSRLVRPNIVHQR